MPRIILTGDILPADRPHTPGIGTGSQFSKAAGENWLSFFEDFDREHDLIFGNLEAPLVSKEIRNRKNKIDFAGDPGFAGWLNSAGFDVVSVANNHILEFGEEGLEQTINALNGAGVKAVGVHDEDFGSNVVVVEVPPSTEAVQKGHSTKYNNYDTVMPDTDPASPAFIKEWRSRIRYGMTPFLDSLKSSGHKRIDDKKLKIGFAGFNDVHDIDIPESISRLSEEGVERSIQQLKKRGADIICLSLHWGNEYVHIPARRQVEFARKAIDLGADLIIGHHPHVIQPVEQYKNGWIFYSLGNFIFDMMWNRSVRTGMTAVLEAGKGGIQSCKAYAVHIQKDYTPVLIEDDPRFKRTLSDNTELMQNLLERGADEYDRYYNKLVKKNRRNARIGMKLQLARQWFSISKEGRRRIIKGWF
jgi:poly-gamma-glutamate capsule biosynthesis protein CapA/YwtB (metallophosphatase superfamily)